MARFFITGSSDGLGSLTAKRLVAAGHQVVLHARNEQRAADAQAACPGATKVLVGDLSNLDDTKALATQANAHGPYAAVVHNAGVYTDMEGVQGPSGLPVLFTVNTLAPYVLTCLMDRPQRLLFISSGLHRGGSPKLESEAALKSARYGDSKLHDIMLANAFARRWPGVLSNSADPGWVPTKMGGSSASGNIEDSVDTFTLLALAEGAAAGKTGTYWAKSKEEVPAAAAKDVEAQDKLLGMLAKISGVSVPDA